MKVDINFYTMLVKTFMENCEIDADIDELKDKLHELLDIAAEGAKSAKAAGL